MTGPMTDEERREVDTYLAAVLANYPPDYHKFDPVERGVLSAQVSRVLERLGFSHEARMYAVKVIACCGLEQES